MKTKKETIVAYFNECGYEIKNLTTEESLGKFGNTLLGSQKVVRDTESNKVIPMNRLKDIATTTGIFLAKQMNAEFIGVFFDQYFEVVK
jgi:hypothetical protein